MRSLVEQFQAEKMSSRLSTSLGYKAWFNNHIVTFYADGALYALDIHTGAVTAILQTATYARIIAVVGTNQIL